VSCVLRAYGSAFDVDAFLAVSRLALAHVWRKGEPRFSASGGGELWDHSGITIDLSEAGWDELGQQVQDAAAFLNAHDADIRRLLSWAGVEFVFCDFGIRRKHGAPMQGAYFPPELTRLVGRLGIGLKLSVYAIAEEQ
jgi:hypothetical protein